MHPQCPQPDLAQAKADFARFLSGQTPDRLFTCPIAHPSASTCGFCYSDWPLVRRLVFYIRAVILQTLLKLPFHRATLWMLRSQGASIGHNVSISPGVWIDPLFPQLLTLEDNVFLGTGVKIATHEFRLGQFRAGKVIIRTGALIGGFALIACGVEIGQGATVAGGAVVGQDVPPGATAIGNPARIIRPNSPDQPGHHA